MTFKACIDYIDPPS